MASPNAASSPSNEPWSEPWSEPCSDPCSATTPREAGRSIGKKFGMKTGIKVGRRTNPQTIPTCQWPLSALIPRLVTPSLSYPIRPLQPSSSHQAFQTTLLLPGCSTRFLQADFSGQAAPAKPSPYQRRISNQSAPVAGRGVAVTLFTIAPAGPRSHHNRISASCWGWPSTSNSTEPSDKLRTQPPRVSSLACRLQAAR